MIANVLLPSKINELQKATPFRPLMRKPVPFFEIAWRARQNHVVDIMTGIVLSTAYRDSMLKMVNVIPVFFLKSGMAVVAFEVLQSQFILNLLSGKHSLYRLFAHSASMPMNTCYYLTSLCFMVVCIVSFLYSLYLLMMLFPISLIVFTSIIAMSFPIAFFVFIPLLSMQLMPLFASPRYLFPMSSLIELAIGSSLFFMLLAIPFFIFNMSIIINLSTGSLTGFALCTKLASFLIKKLMRCRVNVWTLRTTFHTFRDGLFWGFSGRIFASYASIAKPIFSSIEELGSGRPELFAPRALLLWGIILRYNRIHSVLDLLNRLGSLDMQGVSSTLHIAQFSPDYTINPLPKQLQGVAS